MPLAHLLRHPVVTYAMAAVMVAASAASMLSEGGADTESGKALEAARTFYEQNAEVSVSERNRQLLGPDFVYLVSTAYEKEKDRGAGPIFSARMQERTQRRFERLADAAFAARMEAFPAWRHGVGGAGTPPANHLTHAFVHAGGLALAVSLVFFVVAAIGLETAWGSAAFAAFCLLGTLVPGVAFRFLDADGGVPLAGASGLVAATLGAYLVRGIGGRLPVPGFALLPVWLFVELFFVRGIWIDNYDTAPLATLGTGIVTGVGFAAAMRVFGIESKLAERDASERDGRHPAIGVAERALAMENPEAAWKALADAHAESPRDTEVAVAWWELACELGRIDEAVRAIVPVLQDRLRRGKAAEAVGWWRVICEAGCRVSLPPAALVKLGEGLLDEGHPEIALDTLRAAVDAPKAMPTALAQRVVRVARDLDPALTHRAAALALADPALDPATRESLEALADEVRADLPAEPPVAAQAPGPAHAAGEPAAPQRETTRYPVDSDIDLEPPADLTDPLVEELAADAGADGGGDEDPNALSIASLEKALSEDLGLEDGEELTDPDAWNDPGLRPELGADAGEGTDTGRGSPELFDRGGLAVDDPGAHLDTSHLDNSHLDAGALSEDALAAPPALGHAGSASDTAPLAPLGPDPGRLGAASRPEASLGRTSGAHGVPAAADADHTPLAPLGTTPLAALDMGDDAAVDDALGGGSNADTAPLAEVPAPEPDDDLLAASGPALASRPAPAPAPAAAGASPFGDDALDLDLGVDAEADPPQLRTLKLVVGVPVGVKAQALEVEVEGRGVSRVPFERIEAVAVAAVAGLSDKPVLIIDLVLNWLADPSEPLKVVRFHSNRFDPQRVVPSAGSSLEALKRMVAGILERSGAAPLPDAGATSGAPFARFPSAAQYGREVLGAEG